MELIPGFREGKYTRIHRRITDPGVKGRVKFQVSSVQHGVKHSGLKVKKDSLSETRYVLSEYEDKFASEC